jgi:hypothetical protein
MVEESTRTKSNLQQLENTTNETMRDGAYQRRPFFVCPMFMRPFADMCNDLPTSGIFSHRGAR